MSASHWNKIYESTNNQELGWYQERPQPELEMINSLDLEKDAKIVIAGTGTSTLVDELYEQGYSNLILTDISEKALNQLQNRLGDNPYTWIVDDLTNPSHLKDLKDIKLWIDRAVLHFFWEDENIKNYQKLITEVLVPNGYTLFGEFSTDGATRCSGLDVNRYNKEKFKNFLGANFTHVNSRNHTYVNPNGGERPYLYSIFEYQPQ